MKLGRLLTAMGLGVVAGMLLAPKKGSELRQDIKDYSSKTYNNLKDLTKEDVEQMLGQTIETVKKSVDEFNMDDFKESTKTKLEDLEVKLNDFATKIKESDKFNDVKDNVVDLSLKVTAKYEEIKNKINDKTMTDVDVDVFEKEIEDVEEKLEQMIEEIKD